MEKKGLGAFQITMMALGTIVGGSFFLGSSVAIQNTGPSVLLAFALGGVMVYAILFALSEMTVANPASASFSNFATQELGQGIGFVVGWVYWTGMILAMSSEATAVSILLQNWFPSLPISIMGSMIIIVVTLLNLLGANKLSRLEILLAAFKLLAVVFFIVFAIMLILGLLPGKAAVGMETLAGESFLAGGLSGFAGSMLIVMFTYAGFEIIGFTASSAKEAKKTIPKAIRYTVMSIVSLYMLSLALLLLLIPTEKISENSSPIVAALNYQGIHWAGAAMNIVMITAIISTMLASMFGLGRMLRSLAYKKMAPTWIIGKNEVPYPGILSSGVAMLAALGIGLLFPSVYLFLISSGGFAILLTYTVIMITHLHFRRKNECPSERKCCLWGFPYTSYIILIALTGTIISISFVKDQLSGLIAGGVIVFFYFVIYVALKARHLR